MWSELENAEQQLHIYEGIQVALDHRTELLDIVADSTTVEEASHSLVRRLGLTEIQAQAVLDVQVRRLPAGERAKLAARIDELRNHIVQLRPH